MSEFLFVGGNTAPGGRTGISVYRFDEDALSAEPVCIADDIASPSYLSIDAERRIVYACSETANDGALVAYRFDPAAGALTRLASEPTRGAYPCFNLIARDRRHVLAVNYGDVGANPDFAVTAFALEDGALRPSTGELHLEGTGPNAERQERSHPHSALELPDDSSFLIADLGTDLISVVGLDGGKIVQKSTIPMPAGSGPRHMRLHPGKRFVLVTGELDSTVASIDISGDAPKIVDVKSTLPADFTQPNTSADIHLSADGRFVYASNRGHDSIAIFAFDAKTGVLSPLGHAPSGGSTPRNFLITPSGKHLIIGNQTSGNIAALARDPETGLLSETALRIAEPAVTCVKLARLGG